MTVQEIIDLWTVRSLAALSGETNLLQIRLFGCPVAGAPAILCRCILKMFILQSHFLMLLQNTGPQSSGGWSLDRLRFWNFMRKIITHIQVSERKTQ